MSEEIREGVLQLMKQKDKIENDIKQLTEILNNNRVGMQDSLVDNEGFPINSIDIYQVRHARHRIICLQNDHKAVMKQIENGLAGYYQHTSIERPSMQDVEMPAADYRPTVHETPFAKINIVTPGSPADIAKLCVDDLVVEFGSVNATNFKHITDLASVVQYSEGEPLYLKINRGDRFINIKLIPRKWEGKGMLGCNIVPL